MILLVVITFRVFALPEAVVDLIDPGTPGTPGTVIVVDNPDSPSAQHSIRLDTTLIASGSTNSAQNPESKKWLRADMFKKLHTLEIQFSEDLNNNGVLDPGEDLDQNNTIDTQIEDATSIRYEFENNSGSHRLVVYKDGSDHMAWELDGTAMKPCKIGTTGADSCEYSGVPELMLGKLLSWSATLPKLGLPTADPDALKRVQHRTEK